MIRNTYVILPRIGKLKEKAIKKQGVSDWDDFLKKDIKGISDKTKPFYDRKIKEAKHALYSGNSSYFVDKLPSMETWRLYKHFREESVFLDIETSGSMRDSYLTVIGLFDGFDTKTMVKNVNLDVHRLRKEIMKYKLIITFNGTSFDIPFLEKKYPGLLPRVPHIDLRYLCIRVGLTGGLKEIERELGIERNKIIDRLYGGDPLKLWRMFLGSGERRYLNLLVEYNEEDIINLKKILNHVIERLTNH